MSTLGERVRNERKIRGWTQAELARRITRAGYRITQPGVCQIERRGNTSPKSIVQLAEALQVSLAWLQFNRGEPNVLVGSDQEAPSAQAVARHRVGDQLTGRAWTESPETVLPVFSCASPPPRTTV
jgi:transcriptional regulator with XRE-family HTH domain